MQPQNVFAMSFQSFVRPAVAVPSEEGFDGAQMPEAAHKLLE
jgi:hypothetical protein